MGALCLLGTLPVAIFSACAGGGAGGFWFSLLAGVGLSIFLFSAANADAREEVRVLEESGKVLRAKADAGDAEALFQCGAHFENGSGGFVCDRGLATDCYRRAAELGQADAVKRLKLFEENPLDILNRPRRRLRRP